MYNVNFKSTLLPTDYLRKGFDTAINDSERKAEFYNAVEAIINDGLTDTIVFDGKPDSKEHKTVKGKKGANSRRQNEIGEHCITDIIEFASKNKKIKPDPVLNAINSLDKSIFDMVLTAYTSNITALNNMGKQLKVIRNQHNAQAAQKLEEIKAKIFDA